MEKLILLNKIYQNKYILEKEGVKDCRVYLSLENNKVKVNLFCDRNNVELNKFARLEEALRKVIDYKLIELIDVNAIPSRLYSLMSNDMIALSY